MLFGRCRVVSPGDCFGLMKVIRRADNETPSRHTPAHPARSPSGEGLMLRSPTARAIESVGVR